jgi:hypothetical protein
MVMFWLLLHRLPLTYQHNLDEARPVTAIMDAGSTSKHKQILISYVRAEAAEHAVRLKKSLISLGFSVFLVSVLSLIFDFDI